MNAPEDKKISIPDPEDVFLFFQTLVSHVRNILCLDQQGIEWHHPPPAKLVYNSWSVRETMKYELTN